MEDEELMNINPDKKYDNLFDRLKTAGIKPHERATAGSKVYGYGTPLGKSKYDKDLLPSIQIDKDDFFNSLSSYRAMAQPTSHKVGNALGRLTNVIPEALGSVASALDFEDYYNQNDEVGNWLTNITEEWKKATNEALPIYRDKPGKALDVGDVGWWLENGSSLAQSIGGFAIGGGVITKGLQGLSKVTKARKLARAIAGFNKGEKIADNTQTLLTATMLNQAEGILEANDVYNTIYKETLNTLSQNGEPNAETQARQKAADAASATINANRLNIMLNITSANMFMKKPMLTRQLLQKETLKGSLGAGLVEGSQESVEEIINMIAGNYGKAKGRDKKYGFKEILNDIGTPEAAEAALLGFVGGLGQTVVTKEGVNRFNKFTDPETGSKISIRDYNDRAYQNQENEFALYDDYAKRADAKTFTDVFNDTADNIKLNKAYDQAIADGNNVEANKIAQLSLSHQAYTAFRNGTTEALTQLYTDIANGEQKANMDDNYKVKAHEAINKIRSLEKLYNDSAKYINHQQVYINRAHNYDIKKRYDDVNNKLSEAQADLAKEVNIMLDNTIFDPAGEGLYQFSMKGMIADLNEQGSGQTDSYKKAKAEYDRVYNQITSTPEYSIVDVLSKAKEDIKDDLQENIETYKVITSNSYQEKAEEARNNARKAANKKMQDQVKQAEKEIADDIKVEEKAQRDARVQDVKDQAKQEYENAQAQSEEVNNNLSNIADKFNQGEKINLQDLGDDFADEVGTVTKVTENPDGTKEVEITTENGDVITAGDGISPRYKNQDIEDVENTEGSVAKNTSNDQLNKTSIDNDSKKDISKNKNALSDVKMMSTYEDSGKLIPGIPQEFIDYERNGVNKEGTKVTFEISNDFSNAGNKAKLFKEAVSLLDKAKNGETLTKEQKNTIVDYLPIKLKVNDSSDLYTYLMSKPTTDNKDAQLAYNNRSRGMRIALVKALIDGNDINSLSTTIKGQYGGSLNMDDVSATNNPLELSSINNDLSKVELFVLDETGALRDRQGNAAPNWFPSKANDNWKGSVYLKIKKANGQDFYLNLNFGKVSTTQADAIFDVYKVILDKGMRPKDPISKLPQSAQNSIRKNLKPELNMISKVNGISNNDITVSDLLDVLFWDGSNNPKSRLRVDYETSRIEFGDNSYNNIEFTENKREEFVNWVSRNKNRNFKFKSRDSKITATSADYLQYAFDNGVLSTNTKVNEPSFIGFTNLYMNNNVAGITKVKEKAQVKPITSDPFDANVDGKDTKDFGMMVIKEVRYYISKLSGRVFQSQKSLPIQDEVNLPVDKKIGKLITNNALIKQLSTMATFLGVKVPLKTYDVTKKQENPLISQEKVVSLQENEMTEKKPANKPTRKRRQKMTRSQLIKKANERKNNDLNDKCKN